MRSARITVAVGALALLLAIAVVISACGATRTEQLPVVGCKTINAVGSAAPVIPGYLPNRAAVPGGIGGRQAQQLAWYEGDVRAQPGLKILAPRNWSCSALLAADGGWALTVAPSQAGLTRLQASGLMPKQSVEISASYNGPGASIACNYFPSAVTSAPLPEDCKAPVDATITFEGHHLVSIKTTPASASNPSTDLGLLWWYPKALNTAEGVDCILPSARRPLCQAILSEARARIGSELGGAASRASASRPG